MPPKKGVPYTFKAGLVDAANSGKFKVNPTLAEGDFKVSTGNGAFSNLETLPVVTPSGSRTVKFSLSASEMDAYDVVVECSDVAGNEWADLIVSIEPTDANVDDLARSVTPDNLLDIDGDGAIITANAVKLASDGLDLVVIESGMNARQAISIIASSSAGELSGAATSTVVILGAGVATTRISAEVDVYGNRTDVTLAPPP